MNWYAHSPVKWSGMETFSQCTSYDMTAAQALNSIIDNVNNLIAILREPADSTTLRSGKPYLDLSKSEHDKICKHVSEASRALNKIATEFSIASTELTPIIKPEDELKISTPQTNHLVSSFKEIKEELQPTVYMLKKDLHPLLKTETEFDPSIESECISVGKIFDSLEDAAQEFGKYALRCGFNICKGNSKKDVYQEYACSARGKVRVRKINDQDKRRNRKSIKKMCKCHIILRKKSSKWVITTRKLQHTHELLTHEEIRKTAKNRFIPDYIKEKALELYEKGEAPAKIQYTFETELGDRCTWTMKDLYNMLYRHKDSGGDDSSTVSRDN